jgi:hypothetical protein
MEGGRVSVRAVAFVIARLVIETKAVETQPEAIAYIMLGLLPEGSQ